MAQNEQGHNVRLLGVGVRTSAILACPRALLTVLWLLLSIRAVITD